jgi:hypothetical protein
LNSSMTRPCPHTRAMAMSSRNRWNSLVIFSETNVLYTD